MCAVKENLGSPAALVKCFPRISSKIGIFFAHKTKRSKRNGCEVMILFELDYSPYACGALLHRQRSLRFLMFELRMMVQRVSPKCCL